jgi:phage-related minor tail protein
MVEGTVVDRRRAAFVACALLVLAGCGTKGKQCKQITAAVGQGVQRLESGLGVSGKSIEDVRQAAASRAGLYEQLAMDVANLGLEDEKLRGETSKYADMCRAAATAARAYVQAITERDRDRMEAARKSYQAAIGPEADILKSITTVCSD